MKRIILQISLVLGLGLLILGCEKKDTEFRKFLGDGEIVYPGTAGKVRIKPGKYRAAIVFNPSSDQTVAKYVVYWNNKADSLVFPATTHKTTDTVTLMIPNLKEYVYSFTLFSVDNVGHRAVPVQVNNLKVYGTLYEAALFNRGYNAEDPYLLDETKHTAKLRFTPTDTISGFNVATMVKYTTRANVVVEKKLRPDSNSITLPDYKIGTDVQYRSSYIPSLASLDTFYVAGYSTFPTIYPLVQCDKSLFKEVRLPNDVEYYESGTSISKLWDGSVGPQGYPNIFHSNGSYLGHVLTFDMGKTYDNLGRIEETGRDCCNNPKRFEVWGINDLTNAVTTLRGDDPNWKAEAIAKGWTLLKDAVRTDEKGDVAVKFDLITNPPPVRYIRIRVLSTVNNDKASNISELTFWNRQL